MSNWPITPASTAFFNRTTRSVCRPPPTKLWTFRHNFFSALPIADPPPSRKVAGMNETSADQQTALLRVLIADNSPRSSAGLTGLIQEYGDFEMVGHARTSIETLTLIE